MVQGQKHIINWQSSLKYHHLHLSSCLLLSLIWICWNIKTRRDENNIIPCWSSTLLQIQLVCWHFSSKFWKYYHNFCPKGLRKELHIFVFLSCTSSSRQLNTQSYKMDKEGYYLHTLNYFLKNSNLQNEIKIKLRDWSFFINIKATKTIPEYPPFWMQDLTYSGHWMLFVVIFLNPPEKTPRNRRNSM